MLSVALHRLGLRRHFQLHTGRISMSPLILAVAKDKRELERVRDLIAQAMGIQQQMSLTDS
jgi:hypothetical protein